MTYPKTVIWCEVPGCQRGVDTAVYPDAQRADGSYNCGGHSKLDGVVSSEDIQLLEEIAAESCYCDPEFAKAKGVLRSEVSAAVNACACTGIGLRSAKARSLASRLKLLLP